MLSWIKEMIEEEVTKKIEEGIRYAALNSEDKAKRIRMQIINEWFGQYNGSGISAEEVQVVRTKSNISKMKGTLSIESYTDSSLVYPFASAERWRSRYGGRPSNEYVLDLMFDEGIIGLPKYSRDPEYSGMGWKDGVNLFFIQQEPLSSYVKSHPLWGNFMNDIENDILSKIK